MSDNNNGFMGGLASMVKPETKEVKTTGKWEDFWRIIWQTIGLASLRFWQLLALLFSIGAWGYTIAQYINAETTYTGDVFKWFQVGFALIFFLAAIVLAYDFSRELEGGMLIGTVAAIFLIDALFVFYVSGVAAWAMLNAVAFGIAPAKQIFLAGWLPVLSTIIAIAVVPDFQFGRAAFKNELVRQIQTNDPGVIIKGMELDWEREKAEVTNDATIKLAHAEEMLEAALEENEKLRNRPPDKEFVAYNHGRAKASYGNIVLTAEDQEAMIKFINGWAGRGTSRDEWAGSNEQQAAGTHISKPQWEKITRALKNLSILDEGNQPNVGAEEAFQLLKISQNGHVETPLPHPNGSGGV